MKTANLQQSGKPMATRQRGFSLFELIAYILIVSITFSFAFNRFADFPGEAERANFTSIMMQLKSGVTLQMMNGIATGKWNELTVLEGSNPMDLMLETPANYVGELGPIDVTQLPRRIWYFDSTAGELVYLANNTENLYAMVDGGAQPTDHVRLRIAMKYNDEERKDWSGVTLDPVVPFVWESVELQIPATAVQ
jgi:type II secretory pathway pseudopilin PulG